MADVNAEIGVNIDTSGALAQLKALQREIARFHASVAKSSDAAALAQRDLQKNFINGVNAIQGFSAELRTVKTTAENFTDSLERNKFSMREYFRYAGASTKSFGRFFRSEFDTINKVAVENVKRLQTQYIKMGRDANGAMRAIAVMPTKLDMTNLSTQTQLAAQKQAIFNQLVKQGSTNLLNFGKNTQWAGRQLMVGFTIPLMGLGSVATKTFMDMETAAIKFRKVYGDLFTPAEETQFALESIQALGKEFTKYGIAVADTVSLAAEAAAAGFSGSDLQAQVTQATRLQVLGQIDQQKALETTISLQNAFKISSNELTDAINFLNAVENQTVVSLDDITTAIPKAAPIVKELGGDVKDLAFFMAAMKEGGINASEGANALKSGLASLINPTDKAKGMLSDMGINIDQIVEKNVGNLKATVIEFAKALDGLSNLQRQRAIEQLFGKFQQARLSALFDNVIRDGNQASRVLDLASASMEDLASLAEKELGITANSSMNQFRKAVEDLKVALVPVGQAFLEVITPLLDKLNSLLNWFNGLSDTSKKVLTKVVLYLGGLAPVILMTIGLMANFVANGVKGLLLLRTGFLKLTGQSKILGEQTNYLTVEQQSAVAAAASLEQSHMRLQQAFTGEAGAVRQLIAEYQRMIAAQNAAAARFPGMMQPGFKVKGYANGIVSVPGPKGAGDVVPAMVSPGEAIISTAMNKKYAPLVQGIIADNIPGFENSRVGRPSITGGQSVLYGGLALPAPGNTASNKFGMERSFFAEGEGFIASMLSALGGGSFKLGQAAGTETRKRMTDVVRKEYADDLQVYAEEIVSELRATAKNMGGMQNESLTISKIIGQSRTQLSDIFARMRNAGGKAALAAEAIEKHGFFPGMSEITGPLGEVRAPSGKVGDKPSAISMRRLRNSPFQGPVEGMWKYLTKGKDKLSGLKTTYAHVNEARLLGSVMPMSGGGMAPAAMSEQERARLISAINAKGALASQAYSATEIRSAQVLRQQAQKDAETYEQVVQKNTKDIYLASRERRSPHPMASRDGRDDAAAYSKAVNTQLLAASKGAAGSVGSSLINPKTGRPFTQQDIANMSRVSSSQVAGMAGGRSPVFLGMPEMPPSIPDDQQPKTKAKRFGRMRGSVGGFGLSGLVFALSMLPGKFGQLAQSIMPAVFALQAVAMLRNVIGPIPTLLVGMAAGIYAVNKAAKKAAEELADTAKKEAEARYGSTRAIEEYAQFTGRSLPSAREFSRNNRLLISASGEAVKRFAEFYGQKGNRSTAVINQAAMKGPQSGIQAAAIDVAQRAAIFGLGPADIAANIKAAADLIGADQVKLKMAVQSILAPDGKDITKEPLTIKARMEFLKKQSDDTIKSIGTAIKNVSKINIGEFGPLGLGTDFAGLKRAAGYQASRNKASEQGGIAGSAKAYGIDIATGTFGKRFQDQLNKYNQIQLTVQSATTQLSMAYAQETEALGLLNAQYDDGLITKEQYDAQMVISSDNFSKLGSSTKDLIAELDKVDSSGEMSAAALKDMGNQAFAALKKSNPELFKKIASSLETLDKNAQVDIMMAYAQGSMTILDIAKIPELLDKINGKTVTAAIKILADAGVGAGMLEGDITDRLKSLDKEIKVASKISGPDGARKVAELTLEKRELEKALADIQASKKVIPGAKNTSGNGKGVGSGAGDGKFVNPYEKELKLLDKKRDTLKDISDEMDRQVQYQMKQMDLLNQASKAKISGNYLEAASLQQQAMFEGAKFTRESGITQLDRIISLAQERSGIVADTKKLTATDTALLGQLRAGNYEGISPLPLTPKVGFNQGALGFSGSTTTIGGTMYTVTMNITGDNPSEIADKVISKLKVLENKNNKTNKVGNK